MKPEVLEQLNKEAPLCACGCGQQVVYSQNRYGYNSYIKGHSGRCRRSPLVKTAPLCACGCGQPTRYLEDFHRYNKYLVGHQQAFKKLHGKKNQPVSLCACGCGQPTRYDMNIGGFRTFINGHQHEYLRQYRLLHAKKYQPGPLCACGCGERVKYNKNNYKYFRYIDGHYHCPLSVYINLLKNRYLYSMSTDLRIKSFRKAATREGIPHSEQQRILKELGIDTDIDVDDILPTLISKTNKNIVVKELEKTKELFFRKV
jgi:hypothetical protein